MRTCIMISKCALMEAKIFVERRLYIEVETDFSCSFVLRLGWGIGDPLIRLSGQELAMRQLKQDEYAALQGALCIAEYESELDDKCIAKDAHAALMDAKIAEIKSEIAALQGENPTDVAAVGRGATHGFLISASIVAMGGAGGPSFSSGVTPGTHLSPLVIRMTVCGMRSILRELSTPLRMVIFATGPSRRHIYSR